MKNYVRSYKRALSWVLAFVLAFGMLGVGFVVKAEDVVHDTVNAYEYYYLDMKGNLSDENTEGIRAWSYVGSSTECYTMQAIIDAKLTSYTSTKKNGQH